MDFFRHQDQARKHTGILILLFVLAVFAIILLLNLLAAILLWLGSEHTVQQYQNVVAAAGNPSGQLPGVRGLLEFLTLEQWLTISAGVVLVIAVASGIKWLTLRGGGRVVAESLGGKKLSPDSRDFYERRLLNIVEEMAIASGMPVPPVYVLPESGINAFAAGYQPSDAVVGVTRGCMTQLSRDQLQGVIAHEFSHIANGDMRLNIRLMALLFGILFIALIGRLMLHAGRGLSLSREGRKGAALILVVGLAMMAIGYVGVFFGNLIKAAVSRQREYLADASAVQFTRNPESIAGALKVIGFGAGSQIEHPEREETAHLFFGQAFKIRFRPFATHPPLDQRIRRIEPGWNGKYLAPEPQDKAFKESPQALAGSDQLSGSETADDGKGEKGQQDKLAVLAADTTLATAATDRVGSAEISAFDLDVQAELEAQARETWQARALVFSILIAPDTRLVHDQQLDLVLQKAGTSLYQAVLRTLPRIETLGAAQRLTLVQKALPALKQLSESQYRAFQSLVVQLAKADGQIDLFEWCLYRMLLQYLAPQFDKVTPVKAQFRKLDAVKADMETVLSYLAHYGHDDDAEAQKAFELCLPNGALGGLGLGLQPKEPGLKALNLALTRLTNAYPHLKARLLKAMLACAQADNRVRDLEFNLIRTIAAILETPLPEQFMATVDH